MSKPIQVGITGGIGVGKTLITHLFSLLGVPIYYADTRAKELMNSVLVKPIIDTFGEEAFINGTLNRDYLASRVFINKSEINKLNAIVHPAVAIDFNNWVSTQVKSTYIIKEAALLVETGSYKLLDKLILVVSPEELRINRIKKRDPFRSETEIKGIISKQTSDIEKSKFADFIINNNEEELLIPQVIKINHLINSM